MTEPKIPIHPHQHLRRATAAHRSTFTRLARHAAQLIQDREKAREELRAALAAETGTPTTPDDAGATAT